MRFTWIAMAAVAGALSILAGCSFGEILGHDDAYQVGLDDGRTYGSERHYRNDFVSDSDYDAYWGGYTKGAGEYWRMVAKMRGEGAGTGGGGTP